MAAYLVTLMLAAQDDAIRDAVARRAAELYAEENRRQPESIDGLPSGLPLPEVDLSEIPGWLPPLGHEPELEWVAAAAREWVRQRGSLPTRDELAAAAGLPIFRNVRFVTHGNTLAIRWEPAPEVVDEPELRRRFDAALERLGSPDWRVREEATEAIIAMGPAVAPWIDEAMATRSDVEVRSRLEFARGNIGGAGNREILETQEGVIEATDPQIETGEYYDEYRFEARAGQEVIITMTSDAFDCYLYLTGPGGFSTYDDDGGGNLDSRIQFTLPEEGEYVIQAATFSTGETGPYTLMFHVTGEGEAPRVPTLFVYGERQGEAPIGQAMLTIAQAQQLFFANDSDANGINDYWTRDVAGLRCFQDPWGSAVGFIEDAIADADFAPSRTQRYSDAPPPLPVPYGGYFFTTVETGFGEWMVCAFPAQSRASGTMTYIVDSSGSVRQADTRGRPVVRPPEADGAGPHWRPVE